MSTSDLSECVTKFSDCSYLYFSPDRPMQFPKEHTVYQTPFHKLFESSLTLTVFAKISDKSYFSIISTKTAENFTNINCYKRTKHSSEQVSSNTLITRDTYICTGKFIDNFWQIKKHIQEDNFLCIFQVRLHYSPPLTPQLFNGTTDIHIVYYPFFGLNIQR